MRLARRYQENESGLAAIEGALVFPLLIVLGFGVVDTSMLMMQNHKLSAGLTAAGNYLSQARDPQSLETNAKQLAISGNFQSGSDPFIKDLQTSSVAIAYRQISNPESNGARDYRGGDTISIAEITASVPYKGIGFLKTVTGGNITVSARHETRLVSLST